MNDADHNIPLLVILGGSCFVGRTLVETILSSETKATPPGVAVDFLDDLRAATAGGRKGALPHREFVDKVQVVSLNRGTTYWGKSLVEPPYQHNNNSTTTCSDSAQIHRSCHLLFDRDDEVSVKQCAKALINKIAPRSGCDPSSSWRKMFFVDFSCDDEDQMDEFLSALREALQVASVHSDDSIQLADVVAKYVYISSDSVYATADSDDSDSASSSSLSSASSGHDQQQEGPIQETAHCIDPDDSDEEGYGRDKAAMEQELRRWLPEHCCVFLRLPDVVGPFDDTSRYWATLLWGKANRALSTCGELDQGDMNHPAHLLFPRELLHKQISIVFSKDIVVLLLQLLQQVTVASGAFGAFNIGCDPIPLCDFCLGVAAGSERENVTASKQPLQLTVDDEDELAYSCDYFPSVDCGPICLDKAKTTLHWEPTPVDEVLRQTSAFFETMGEQTLQLCEEEFKRALKKLPRAVKNVVSQLNLH